MKFTLLCLFVALLSVSAFAQDVSSKVKNPVVVVSGGGGYAAVMPTAHLQFQYASCAKMPLRVVSTHTGNSTYALKVILPQGTMDCMAMPTLKTYSLQISSNAGFYDKYILNRRVLQMKQVR